MFTKFLYTNFSGCWNEIAKKRKKTDTRICALQFHYTLLSQKPKTTEEIVRMQKLRERLCKNNWNETN